MPDVKAVPDGFPQVIPYLSVDGAAAALDFYRDVFGAKERTRVDGPDGRVGHAEIEIGDSLIMLSDEMPDVGTRSPKAYSGTPVTICLYLEDVDAVYERAIRAGATAVSPVQNQFYGDRSGQFTDPFGHRWNVATHVEDVSPDEMARRAAELAGGPAQ